MSDRYHEAHVSAEVHGRDYVTVFCTLEYDANEPPDVIAIDGVRWIREDIKTFEE